MRKENEIAGGACRGRFPGKVWMLAALLVATLAGCSHRSDFDRAGAGFTRVYTPQVPEFLSGPAGALLTNSSGFSARATYESHTPAAPGGVDTMEGELLARGTRLLFAPRTSDKEKKVLSLGGFSFLWDVASGSGFVMSEALQGYAPVSSTVKITGLKMQPETVSGETSAVVTMDTGNGWLFHLSCPADAKGVPSQLSSVTNAPAFSLRLARLRLEAPPESLFEPPAGFIKYPTPEALADELAARKSNIRRGAVSEAQRIYQNNYGR